jgi:hypothetical protein
VRIEPKSELKERSAALNTQLRFGRERPALVHAYRLRTYLQLRGARMEAEQQELERVEKIISVLETRKLSGIQKLIKSIIEMGLAALNPEVDEETTLLDRFKTPGHEGWQEEDDDTVEETQEPTPEAEAEAGLSRSEPVQAEAPRGLAGSLSGEAEDDWGWGSEAISPSVTDSQKVQTPSPQPRPAEASEEDYWGGGEGYRYDDKF